MTTPAPAIFWDRTRRSTDQKCPRRRYWAFEHGGLGISPRQSAAALSFGIALHGVIEGTLLDDPARVGAALLAYQDEVATRYATHADAEVITRQHVGLLRGMQLGFTRLVLPALRAEYDIEVVEQSLAYAHAPGFRYGFKPDVILRRKDDGTFWYVDWKSTAKADNKWMKSWDRAIQLHLAAYAFEQVTGKPITGVIVQGFLKGRKEDDAYLASPLIGGWTRPEVPPMLPAQFAAKRPREWKGWRAISAFDLLGGQEEWFDLLGESLLSEFPRTAPIFLQRDIVESTFRQAAWREREIAAAKMTLLQSGVDARERDLLLERAFPQTFDACEPAWGEPCEYLHCCWTPEVAEDPLATGLFVPREPHHSTEFEE